MKTNQTKRRKQDDQLPLPKASASAALFRKKLAKEKPATPQSRPAAEKAALARLLNGRTGWLEDIVFNHRPEPVRLSGESPLYNAGPGEDYALKVHGTYTLNRVRDEMRISSRDGWVFLTLPTKAGHLNTIVFDVFIPPGTPFYWGIRAAVAGTTDYRFIAGNGQDKDTFVKAAPDGGTVSFLFSSSGVNDGHAELLFWPSGLTTDWLLYTCSIYSIR